MDPAALAAQLETITRECIAVRVRLLNRVVTKIYDDALRPWGLKVSQLNILVAAGKLGLARPREVCRRLHLDASTLSRNVDRLRARGWVEAVPGGDARTRPFRLTPAGKRLLQRAAPAWTRAQAEAGALFGEGGLTWLRTATRTWRP